MLIKELQEKAVNDLNKEQLEWHINFYENQIKKYQELLSSMQSRLKELS